MLGCLQQALYSCAVEIGVRLRLDMCNLNKKTQNSRLRSHRQTFSRSPKNLKTFPSVA